MPDSVNVSETQPSMERHTSGVSSSPNCKKKNPPHLIIYSTWCVFVCFTNGLLSVALMAMVTHFIHSGPKVCTF